MRLGGLVGDQAALDALLLGDRDRQVALDHRLAGEGVTRVQILGREAEGRTAARPVALDEHGAAAAASLPATRLRDLQPGLLDGFRHERPGGDLDRLVGRQERDLVIRHRR